jgi:uncharacterized protein (TIGR02145 family)
MKATMHAQKKPGQLLTNSIKAAGMLLSWALLILSFTACLREDPAQLPALRTLPVTEIHWTSATSGGDITNEGGEAILSRGIVWGSLPGPTIDKFEGITNEGSGAGNFTSTATDLDPATRYYMRAYATSVAGTAYGNEVDFQTRGKSGLPYGTMTDIEGNTYRTIGIGTQTWMAENLRTTKFNDDSAIPLVADNNTWAGLSTPAYCWYDNDPEQHAPNYGALYSWSTVETGKLCPTGWHVPSDAEWTVLADFLGGDAGGKMKETGTSHWEDPNTGATNSSGFTAVPGGVRSGHDGIFYDVSLFGNWWSSTADSNGDALYRNMYTDDAGLGRHGIIKSYGYSVRCLRD